MDGLGDILNVVDIPIVTAVLAFMWHKERARSESLSAKYEALLRKLAGLKNPLVDENGELVVPE